MSTCPDCGCKVYNGRCVNCDEELFIIDQYEELGMPLPDEDTDFMKKARESELKLKEENK